MKKKKKKKKLMTTKKHVNEICKYIVCNLIN
jgi:hypothetical protein